MLMKLIDEILSVVGVVFSLLLTVIIGTLAYYYFPVATCVVGGIAGLLLLCSLIASLEISFSEAQMERMGKILVGVIVLTAIGFALYYFPKTTTVLLFLIVLGVIAEQIEKRKGTNKAA